MTDKLNIILDLDETCIHQYRISKNHYNNFDNYRNKIKNCGIESYVIKTEVNGVEYYLAVFVRPYLKKLLKFLFQNYTVSIWSNANHNVVSKVCKIIFTSRQLNQVKYIIGKNVENHLFSYMMGPYDIKNKKFLYSYSDFDIPEVKNLSYLFNNKPYSNLFNKRNTILIDNDKKHLKFNETNIIYVKDFYNYETDDNILLNILYYFTNKIITTYALPTFKNNNKYNIPKKEKAIKSIIHNTNKSKKKSNT